MSLSPDALSLQEGLHGNSIKVWSVASPELSLAEGWARR